MPKNLVVFGGTGWIGQHIVRTAVAAGWNVTACSRSGAAPHRFPDAWQVQWLPVDATSRAEVDELFTRVPTPVDAVISTIGMLTYDRTTAVVINGSANTNILSAMYKRQQMILTEQEEAMKIFEDVDDDDNNTTDDVSNSNGKNQVESSSSSPSKKDDMSKDGSAAKKDKKKSNSDASTSNSSSSSNSSNKELKTQSSSTAVAHTKKSAVSELPALTNHKSGLPRFVYISAAPMGFPITKIFRGYYDGKITTEKAMLAHAKARGAILRPAAVHGLRWTAQTNIPFHLSPIFAPMELIFPTLHRLTGLSFFQPPIHVNTVASAALAAASPDFELDDELKALRIDGGYGHSRANVINFNAGNRVQGEACPIFEYDGMRALARRWKA